MRKAIEAMTDEEIRSEMEGEKGVMDACSVAGAILRERSEKALKHYHALARHLDARVKARGGDA